MCIRDRNTGADSYGTAVTSTCIARIMYVAATQAPASDGAESLIAWLQGEIAQRSLATTGAAYPIDGVLAADTKAEWLMGISGNAVVTDETIGSLDAMNAWLSTWNSAIEAPAPASTPEPTTEPATEPQTSSAVDPVQDEAGAEDDGSAAYDDEE